MLDSGHPYPKMSPISISTDGIQEPLKEVDTEKESGSDNIPAWVLKHCTIEIYSSYSLNIILTITQQSTQAISLMTDLQQIQHQCSEKKTMVILQTIPQYCLHQL